MHVRRSLAATLATGALLLAVLAPASALAATADADTSEPMAALADFSSILLLGAVLVCWYAAAVAIRRRTTRPSRDD